MTLTLTYDLDLQSPESYGHDLLTRKSARDQWSIGSEDRVETNGQTDRRTDGGDRITSLANEVGKNRCPPEAEAAAEADRNLRRVFRAVLLRAAAEKNLGCRRQIVLLWSRVISWSWQCIQSSRG